MEHCSVSGTLLSQWNILLSQWKILLSQWIILLSQWTVAQAVENIAQSVKHGDQIAQAVEHIAQSVKYGDQIAQSVQEGVGSITFGRHVSNGSKCMYSKSWHQELSIGIYMGPIGGGGWRGGSEGVQICLDPPPKLHWATPTKF